MTDTLYIVKRDANRIPLYLLRVVASVEVDPISEKHICPAATRVVITCAGCGGLRRPLGGLLTRAGGWFGRLTGRILPTLARFHPSLFKQREQNTA